MAGGFLARRYPLDPPAAFRVVRCLLCMVATGLAVALMEGSDCFAALRHAVHARQPRLRTRLAGAPRPAANGFSTGEFS